MFRHFYHRWKNNVGTHEPMNHKDVDSSIEGNWFWLNQAATSKRLVSVLLTKGTWQWFSDSLLPVFYLETIQISFSVWYGKSSLLYLYIHVSFSSCLRSWIRCTNSNYIPHGLWMWWPFFLTRLYNKYETSFYWAQCFLNVPVTAIE